MKPGSLSFLFIACLSLWACKHPLEIVGDGDILSNSGARDCTLEDFQSASVACTDNAVTSGDYIERYTAEPRPGWWFDGWENYCPDTDGNQCFFNIPASIVEAFPNDSVPPLRAVFAPLPTTPGNPNVVIIYVDDMGYADIGAFGATAYATPHLDALAADGVMLTDFYVSEPACSASRASLLTGSYATRIGITSAIDPLSPFGLNSSEETLAEMFKAQSYRTAMFGKWHLGSRPEFNPILHGFDEFFGIPFSHDYNVPIPLLEGQTEVELNPDPNDYTVDFTNRATSFITQSVALGEPFFLYLAHPMPHVPVGVSAGGQGQSGAGIYGDVVQEIDWSVGQIISTLQSLGVDDDTLVIFTSDNGPWLPYGDHAGSADPLREGKGTVFDGGVRVPFIARMPGVLPAGRVVEQPAMNIDILPTLAELIGAPLPSLSIDGESMWSLLTRQSFTSPQEAYFFYHFADQLQAMRSGKWKLVFPHIYLSIAGQTPGSGGIPGSVTFGSVTTPKLYDMQADPGETTDLADSHPDIVASLTVMADAMRAKLGDTLQGIPCSECRAPGFFNSEPQLPRYGRWEGFNSAGDMSGVETGAATRNTIN